MKPLKGSRIVSLALNLPGPAALMRCCAMGAHCLKVEPLSARGAEAGGGDPMHAYSPAAYAQMHVGVQTLGLDLKTPEGQARLSLELDRADILLTSFRPSALARLGLDWPALHQRYPKLWQVAIVGAAGGAGTQAEAPGHDLTYLAAQGLVRGDSLPATLYADMMGSLIAVEAILGVALKIKLADKPKKISVSLSQAAQYAALPRLWGLTLPSGIVGGAHAGYQIYPCQDGRAAVAALEPNFAKKLCLLAGIEIRGVADMMNPSTKTHLIRWFTKKTCAAIHALAKQHDLPICTMSAGSSLGA